MMMLKSECRESTTKEVGRITHTNQVQNSIELTMGKKEIKTLCKYKKQVQNSNFVSPPTEAAKEQ